jgi:hypothetical protein
MLKVREIRTMRLESWNAYGIRRRMANTHFLFSQTRRHIVEGMVGAAALGLFHSPNPPNSQRTIDMAEVRHSTLEVGPVTVFYREAGAGGQSGSLVVAWLCKLIALLSAPDAAAFI